MCSKYSYNFQLSIITSVFVLLPAYVLVSTCYFSICHSAVVNTINTQRNNFLTLFVPYSSNFTSFKSFKNFKTFIILIDLLLMLMPLSIFWVKGFAVWVFLTILKVPHTLSVTVATELN